MAKNDDIEVKIPDDEPVVVAEAAAAKGAKAEEPKVVSPEEAMETLKGQLATEKAARAAAEQRANAQAEATAKAQTEVLDTNQQLVSQAIETVKQNQAIAKARYAEAMGAQDFAAAADAQEEIASNASRMLQLTNGLEALKQAPKPRAQTVLDPAEELARQIEAGGSPRSAQWLRQHPEYGRDNNLLQGMLGAHNVAISRGIRVDSDDYFDFVENALGISGRGGGNGGGNGRAEAEDDALSEGARASGGRQAAPAAAPVSRGGSGNGSPQRTMRLTADEIEIAGMMGQTPEEYARNKAALQKEGRLN